MDVITQDCKVNNRKSTRKQKRARHRLLRDMNIKCTDKPTQHLMICNGGLVTGISRETLQYLLDALVSKYALIMPSNKSYCFITCNTIEEATHVYNRTHGHVKLPDQNSPLYMCYTETVPDIEGNTNDSAFPAGLKLIENFITKEQEETLLKMLDWDECESTSQLKHRQVKHFGYEFEYGTNMVDPCRPIAPIPQQYKFLQTLFDKHSLKYTYDQLTINKYLPGQGIPSHVDTHSIFEDTILSLSLGSSCVMSFKRADQKIDILLPPRSLLIMTEEARYGWTHGICPRRSDVVDTKNGSTIQERDIRVSFTFRKVRRSSDCRCDFQEHCDARRQDATSVIDSRAALGVESSYVHKIYEKISDHFSETRHKQWPNVAKFLANLEEGTLLLDVGCGNGKYLCGNRNIYKLGCDRSSGLTDICRKRNFEVLLCDCLYLPYRDESVDATISIAVIHHVSTRERRKRAISEMMRVLKPNGQCLIYVWAKEQRKDSAESFYLKYGSKQQKSREIDHNIFERDQQLTLPIHENRTNFTHSDMLVPWKTKDGESFLRYYHVFEEDELAKLCTEVPATVVKHTYYDQGNWCVVLEKCI